MAQTKRHKVFISYHVDDQEDKDRFAQMMENDIVDKSVKDDDIDDTNLKVETIRQKMELPRFSGEFMACVSSL